MVAAGCLSPERGGAEQMLSKAFRSRRLLAFLGFSGLITVTVLLRHSIAQQPGPEPGYFLRINLGQGWQTSISLTNLENHKVNVDLTAYDQAGRSLAEIPAIMSLEAEATNTFETATSLLPRQARHSSLNLAEVSLRYLPIKTWPEQSSRRFLRLNNRRGN
jgi:hypothetical protein